jgi:uncharacterized caspase-like protein
MLTLSYSTTVIEPFLNRFLSWMMGITLVTILAIGTSADASAERRVALVIGNSNYKVADISLVNPRNDSQDISSVLTTLGFEVVTAIDATKRDMEFALLRFARLAIDADSALFFYAGHAMWTDPDAPNPTAPQHPVLRPFRGHNFLMPTDAEVEDEISLRYQTVDLEMVRAMLDRISGVKIVILDASTTTL